MTNRKKRSKERPLTTFFDRRPSSTVKPKLQSGPTESQQSKESDTILRPLVSNKSTEKADVGGVGGECHTSTFPDKPTSIRDNKKQEDTVSNDRALVGPQEKASQKATIPQQTVGASRAARPMNLLAAIMDRSVDGSNHMNRQQLTQLARKRISYKSPSWIKLSCGSAPQSFDDSPHLAWDTQGILLAATSKDKIDGRLWVHVFDWDLVRSLDRKGRNHHAKDGKRGGSFTVGPILSFPGSRYDNIKSLHWNPFDPDELVIGFNNGDAARYDLGEVNAWYSSRSTTGPPPCRKWNLRDLTGNFSFNTFNPISAIRIIDKGRHIIVASIDAVRCINIATNKRLWCLRWRITTCIEPLSTDVLLLASRDGRFAIINWRKLQRTSFSRFPSPTILDEWLSYGGLETPGYTHMGITYMRLLKNVSSSGSVVPWRFWEIQWTTSCGWVLRSMIQPSDCDPPRTPRILFSTKPVRCVNARGETVTTHNRSWSLPVGSCPAGSSEEVLAWSKVDAVTQILPHHDKRVLQERPRSVRSGSRPGFQLMTSRGSILPSIACSKACGEFTAVAIHPSEEWIVASCTGEQGLVLLKTRSI